MKARSEQMETCLFVAGAVCTVSRRKQCSVSLTNQSVAYYSFYKAAPCSPESIPNVCGSLCCFRQCTTCHHAATDGNNSWGLSYKTWAGEAGAVTSTRDFHAWGLSFSSCSREMSCGFQPQPTCRFWDFRQISFSAYVSDGKNTLS